MDDSWLRGGMARTTVSFGAGWLAQPAIVRHAAKSAAAVFVICDPCGGAFLPGEASPAAVGMFVAQL